MVKNFLILFCLFSFLMSHFIDEVECPKCEECIECIECEEKECPPCPDICDGECYSDEEAQNIELYINELEHKDSLNIKIIESLDKEIYMYIHQDSLSQSIIKDMEHTIDLRDKLIKEVTPKWYENKWLWFGMGVFGTAIIVK